VRQRLALYAITVGVTVLVVIVLLRVGTMLWPSPADVIATDGQATPFAQLIANASAPLARLLIQLVTVIVLATGLGRLAVRLGQPAVIGEIAAGIVVGPSLLGAVAPGASAALFAASSLPTLQMLSQIGVLLFMFVVGVDLDLAHIRGRTRVAIAVSHFSIAVPFALGVGLALTLYGSYAPPDVPFHAFALFLGVAMSITAFPVLARILIDRRMSDTPLGTMALTCAAVDDVTAWSLLALVSAVAASQGAGAPLFTMIVCSAIFVTAMVFPIRALLRRLLATSDSVALKPAQIVAVLALMLISALTTELIGIHAIFGAFLAGVVLPATPALRQVLRERIGTMSTALLLPLFFAYTGLRTEIGLLGEPADWLVCFAIVVVATLGKMGGTIAAARWTGAGWHEAAALGALMNTRGLMELVALNVGYDLGIVTPRVFTMMVLMALATTAMTGPMLSFLATSSTSLSGRASSSSRR